MDLDRVNELGFEKTPKWHLVILAVAFNKWWNIFIAIQSFGTFLGSTYTLATYLRVDALLMFRYTTDVIYVFDIVCMITYRLNPKIRKMKYVKARHWFFIVIDIISVIPFELIYFCHGVRADLSPTVQVWLVQNRGLRIYRIVLLESYYESLARKYSQYVVVMIFGVTFRLLVVSNILCCFWITVEDTVGCNPEELECFIWCECHMIDLVLLNWSGEKDALRDPWERFIASVAMLSGFLIIFAYCYPRIFYYGMLLFYEKALYYKELEKLEAFFRNMVHDRKLKSEILHRFAEVWKKEQTDTEILFENIPSSVRKQISSDIYWEVFQHSDLFREVSRSCKRSLSLLMKTEHYHSGEVIYHDRQNKIKMMFLSEGIVQIMAEENNQSPLLSFSNGTILGEMCLFYHLRSRAILKCQTRTEIQILTMRDSLFILKDYPKDRDLVFHNLCERLKIAKSTQWRKKKFGVDEEMQLFVPQMSSAVDCVKWLKKQWKGVSDSHKRYLQLPDAKKQSFLLNSLRDNYEINIKIDYVSNYLDLIVLSEFVEEKRDRVCFRTSFPWSMNPSSQFFRVWYYVVLVTSLIPALLYPFCSAWVEKFPRPMYKLSFAVTLVFITDVFLKLFTAVKTKQNIITEFFAVLRYLFQKPTFYFDLIAAFPYQIIVFKKDIDTVQPYEIGLPLHPAILKCYVFVLLKVPLGNYFDKITIFKNFMIYFLILYWAAEVVQLVEVRVIVETKHEWFKKIFMPRSENFTRYYGSVLTALVIALSIPEYIPAANLDVTIACTIAKYFFFLHLGYFLTEIFGSKTVKIYGPANFQILMKRISKILESMYISERLTTRLLNSLKFQWEYDKADYLSSKKSIVKTIPLHLRHQVYSRTTYETLRLCPIFQDESLDFLIAVMEKSYVVAVPRGSVLVTFGHICHLMSILHQGYCQMDSYLACDTHAELGRPIKVTRGQVFPVLSTLYCIPSPVSVVTTTDCEVIMIHLNDLLNVMMKHNIFKDMTETLLELNFEKYLLNVAPGLLKVNICNPPADIGKVAFRKVLAQRGFCWKLFFWFAPSKNYFKRNFFKYWSFFYVLYLTVVCWLWPCCFGWFLKSSHILIPILTAAKIISLVHLILRFYFPYYNKKGLLVSHPAFTCLHYLSSGFIADLFIAVPVYAIYLYGFNGPRTEPHFLAVLLLFVQLFFKMNYIMGFLNYISHLFLNKYFMRILKIVLGLMLTFNMFVNFTMFLYTKWIFGGPYRVVAFEPLPNCYPTNSNLLRYNSCTDYYVFTAYWILTCLTTTDYFLHKLSEHQILYSYVQAFIGIFGSVFLFVWVASNFIFENIQGTIFQEKVFSLIGFLKYEKVDDGVIDYVKSYYNYEWSQTHGEKLKELCDYLPLYLQEELVYPIYRRTFSRNKIFTGADEGFFKILATKVASVFYNRGSIIMFQNEVQSNIFFVHKGKCFVYDWFLVLDNGSIVGDIHQTGVMRNKVYALTHVHMLTITSGEFFSILNGFYTLEANFLYWVKNAENFVKSDIWRAGQQLHLVDSKDVLNAFCLKTKTLGFEDESIFEDPENSSIQILKNIQFSRKKKRRLWTIYPGTWKIKVYTALRFLVTMVTFLSFPIFLSFGGLTVTAFAVFGVTDFFWLLCIILTFRVAIIDSQKGNVITDLKSIAKDYATRVNGLVVDLLALIPFELIPVAVGKGIKSANGEHVAWARIFRLIRGHCFYYFLKNKAKRLENNIYMEYFFMISFVIVALFHSTGIYIDLATEPSIVAARNHHVLKTDQFFAFVFAFEYVINFVSSTNLFVIAPDTRNQLHFFNLNIVLYLLLKGFLISKILSTLYVYGVAVAYCKSQMLELESYLKDNDTSPSIIRQVLTYRMNLFHLSRSENMPSLLKKAPSTMRVLVMRNIYIKHLINCPLFEGISRIFLDQLVARATRELYFPGQVIVGQGDVDHRMYFIHSGEVYVITETQDRAYIERVKRIVEAGTSFGEAQGLWLSIPHYYTYRARTVVDLLVIHSDDWMDLRRSFPDIVKEILENAKCLKLI